MPFAPRPRPPAGVDITLLIPPATADLHIGGLDDALWFGTVTDLFEPFAVLVAWLGGDGRLLHLAATRGHDADPAAAWPALRASGGPAATSAVLYGRVPDERVDTVVEADLVTWRSLRASPGVPVVDWILVGPSQLRSLAATTGTAPPDWEPG